MPLLGSVAPRAVSASLLASLVWLAAPPAFAQPKPATLPRPNAATVVRPVPPDTCRLLDDPATVARMDGLVFSLAVSCQRHDLLGAKLAREAAKLDRVEESSNQILATDQPVNNRLGESGSAQSQSETSIARNDTSGTLCSAFNDSYEFFGANGGGGLTGFARSTDGGASWVDQGAVGPTAYGDPSLAWRKVDGKFYLATLEAGGALAVWRSDDDCDSFTQISIPSTGSDDKEILIVDNSTLSPYYGSLYLVWTDFGVVGTPIRFIRSTNGGTTWSAPITLGTGTVQGAWPTVSATGQIFVAWLEFASWPAGNLTIRVSGSTNGGTTFTARTPPLVDAVSPRDATASSTCGRPALNGNLRYLASPQLTVTANDNLHIVFSHDPGAFNDGDVVDAFYRRSTDGGSTWSAPMRLSSTSTHDQFFPTIQKRGNTLLATWYDRRHTRLNLDYHYYSRTSTDAGLTWAAEVRRSDVDSPVILDPNLATCYHGDYDQSLVLPEGVVVQWADDRDRSADVWTDVGP
jgi:hypothetical protein